MSYSERNQGGSHSPRLHTPNHVCVLEISCVDYCLHVITLDKSFNQHRKPGTMITFTGFKLILLSFQRTRATNGLFPSPTRYSGRLQPLNFESRKKGDGGHDAISEGGSEVGEECEQTTENGRRREKKGGGIRTN